MDQKAITAREKKLAFFRELDKLDEISDDNETDHRPKVTREKPTSSGLNAPGTLVPGSPDCVFVEARAAPKPKTGGSSSDAISVVKETPYPPQLTKNTVVKNAKGQMEDSPSNRPGAGTKGTRGRKKKSSSTLRELPKSQQIFEGLVFC